MVHLTFYGTFGVEMEQTLTHEEFDKQFVKSENDLAEEHPRDMAWR